MLLRPGVSDYPAVLRRCSDNGHPSAVTARGDLSLLEGTLTGFFCSVHVPGDTILRTYDLARALRESDMTLIGGFQSPMEKEFLDLLLRGTMPVVFCPARGLGKMRVPKGWKKLLSDGHLLILSFFDDNIHRPTITIAARRNTYVAALADRILIAYAESGSKTEKLCKGALARGKQVFTLDSTDNAHLVELGTVPISANNLGPLSL